MISLKFLYVLVGTSLVSMQLVKQYAKVCEKDIIALEADFNRVRDEWKVAQTEYDAASNPEIVVAWAAKNNLTTISSASDK